jgi:predicted fused transcriptional regulator/phosphomethylpyrimidine kinase
MTTPMVYWWQQTYDAAVLEMDLAQVPGRVVTALKAIEERLRSCIEYGGIEHLAIVDARRALATLKAGRR